MESEIKITPEFRYNHDGAKCNSGHFDVEFEGKKAIGLGYDEMLGLVSAITMSDTRPCLQWLKTDEQIKAWDDKYNPNKNNPNKNNE